MQNPQAIDVSTSDEQHKNKQMLQTLKKQKESLCISPSLNVSNL
jgi:hypothetical protein